MRAPGDIGPCEAPGIPDRLDALSVVAQACGCVAALHATAREREGPPEGAVAAPHPAAATHGLVVALLDDLAAQLPAGSVVSFVDPPGVVRWLGGDPAAVAELASAGLRRGARCLAGVAPAAPPERPVLEIVGAEPRAAGWCCAAAPVRGCASAEPVGVVHVAARALAPRALAGDLARVLGERLGAARSVRDQVLGFALRAAPPTEARLAVDADGRLLDANPAGRRWLGVTGELPAHLAGPVRAALAAAGAAGDPELLVEAPGASAVRLAATVVRYERAAVGAVLRVVEAGPRPAAARAGGTVPSARYALGQILGASRAVAAALDLARTAARNDLPVVIEGESGTGKELFAQAIHALGARAGGPFVAVNCGCIPATLVEAELFGYEPGTFTGGRREGNVGKFEKASRGTIFLDEVSELPAQAQAALLRVLQEREVVRLGGCAPRRIDIRVIAATNRSLAHDVEAGRFRADLYFRLAVLPIAIPPLRDRREDVALLARAFLREAEIELGQTGLALADGAVAALEAYPWPGNVRELRNVVLRTAATTSGRPIEVADLPEELRRAPHAPGAIPAAPPPARRHPGGDGALDREALLSALDASGWNVARTAQALHVSRMTLYRWLSKHQIAR